MYLCKHHAKSTVRMAEGIEVGFLGKLTYYAISIYILFILGFLIVCRQRYKSRKEHRDRTTNSFEPSEQENTDETKAKEMGLFQSKTKDSHSNDDKIKSRRRKAKQHKAVDNGARPRSVHSVLQPDNKAANGQLAKECLNGLQGNFQSPNNIFDCDDSSKPLNLRSSTENLKSDEEQEEVKLRTSATETPESFVGCVTSGNFGHKDALLGVISAEKVLGGAESSKSEMGRTETSIDSKKLIWIGNKNTPSKSDSFDVCEIVNGIIDNSTEENLESAEKQFQGSNIILEKRRTDDICNLTQSTDNLNSFATSVSCSVGNGILSELDQVSPVSNNNNHFEIEKDSSVSHSGDIKEIKKEVSHFADSIVSHVITDGISEAGNQKNLSNFANILAHEILFGIPEDEIEDSPRRNSTPSVLDGQGNLLTRGSIHAQENLLKGVSIDIQANLLKRVSADFCEAIADSVCRDASNEAKYLENYCNNLCKSVLGCAKQDYTALPTQEKKIPSEPSSNNNLRVLGQRRKIFRSTENIADQGMQRTTSTESLQSFSQDFGKNILDDALSEVKCKCIKDSAKMPCYNEDCNQNDLEGRIPKINIDDFDGEDTHESPGARRADRLTSSASDVGISDDNLKIRLDSQSNFDADDEGDDDRDSSDESEVEQKPNVVLRNKHTMKLKLHSDRPLSGYAEQLVQFLADDDDGLDLFESDEEFDAVLDKMEAKYKNDEKINNKIQKRRKLSRNRKCSDCSEDLDSPQKHVQRLDSLDDYDDEGDRLTSTLSESSLLSGTDTDDALRGAFSDDSILTPGTAKYNMKPTVVIDTGCGVLKAGIAGEVAPQYTLPSVIGVPRRFSQDISKMDRGYYVGEEAIFKAGMLQLDHPIKPHVTNWSDVYSLLEYVIEAEMQVNLRDHPVLLTEIGLMPRKHREKLTEIMFEKFGVQAFFLANQGPLSLYSMGLTSGLCVNSGYATTQAIPVYDGHSLPYCTKQLDVGGKQISSYLGRLLLSGKGLAFSSSSEKFLLSHIMERYCYVAHDLKEERVKLKKQYDDVRKFYELPDGQLIEIDSERFESAEILFYPESIGLEQDPLQEMIIKSVASANPDLKSMLMNNTLVTGGTTLLPGFTERLESELSALNDHTGRIKLTKANNPVMATWTGASVISSRSTFSQQCISADQYAESGAQIVHLKCF